LTFLVFALSRAPVRVSRATALSFIPVCRFLGNERLELALLSSLETGWADSTIDISESTLDHFASRVYC
jgi:hypothetical protein